MIVFFIFVAFVLSVVVILFTYSKPLYSFLVLIILMFTIYSWYGVEIDSNTVSFVDGYLIVYLFTFLLLIFSGKLVINLGCINKLVLIPLSIFVYMIFILPLLGIIRWGLPVILSSSGIRFVEYFLLFIITLVLVYNYKQEAIIKIIYTLFVIGILHSSFSILQFAVYMNLIDFEFSHYDFTGQRKWYLWGRATGFLVQPNSFGMFMSLIGLLAFGFMTVKTKYINSNSVIRITFFLSVISIILSNSRTAFVMFLIGIVFIGLHTNYISFIKKTATITVISGVLLVLIGQFNQKLSNRFVELWLLITGDGSDVVNWKARVHAWQNVLSDFLNYPLGTWVAPDHFRDYTGLLNLDTAIDSYYFTSLLQGGILFLLSFLFCMICLFIYGIINSRKSKQYNSESMKALNLILSAAIIEFLLGSISLSPILEYQMSTTLWIMLALSVGVNYLIQGRKPIST